MVDQSNEMLTAAINRVSELDALLNVYVAKTAAQEEKLRASAAAAARADSLESENRVRSNPGACHGGVE